MDGREAEEKEEARSKGGGGQNAYAPVKEGDEHGFS